ncbi:MAG: hypothetical protein H0S85_12240 [Desulfovibrionaceae bacterium]|jgi:hypothetical protein|nr:hypothetical protein [Desulfovibrionaceae bacterium]
MKRHFFHTLGAALLAAALLAPAGCALRRQEPPPDPALLPANAAAPYHEAALMHFKEGREFMSQGRYELARESFLLALAAADNGDMRVLATRELETADRMIRSVR